MLYRKGDRVSVEGVVKHDAAADYKYISVQLSGHNDASFEPQHLTLIAAKFGIGDHVIVFNMDNTDSGLRGEVVAINGDYLWLDCDENEMRTALSFRCQRVESPAPGGTVASAPADPVGFAEPPTGALAELIEAAPLFTNYTVKEGDTLESIAGTFADDPAELRKRNGIGARDSVPDPGTVLRVDDNIPF